MNREELHNVDLAKMKDDPDIGFFKGGKWIWNHNAEDYARENYYACLANLQERKPFKNTNIPPGHVYKPWTLESEYARMRAGIKSDLKQNGDWSS